MHRLRHTATWYRCSRGRFRGRGPSARPGLASQVSADRQSWGAKLPKLWSLPAKEVAAIKLNGWAFLFGPFYYAAKGMWKTALSLLGLAIVILFGGAVVLEAMGISPDLLLLVGPAIFMGQANVSYYRRVKEGLNRWW